MYCISIDKMLLCVSLELGKAVGDRVGGNSGEVLHKSAIVSDYALASRARRLGGCIRNVLRAAADAHGGVE